MNKDNIIKVNDWRNLGFDKNMSRPISSGLKPTDYLPGANFDVQLDELSFNRVIQFKGLDRQPQGSVVGKTYYDKETGKVKVWVGGDAKWADIQLTTTSTSTTSSSSSSSSISTSTTSSSSSSSSTSTTI